MLVALEAKQRLVELLNAYVDTRQHEVRVVVGLEGESIPAMPEEKTYAATPPSNFVKQRSSALRFG